jgi:hypothetical protein
MVYLLALSVTDSAADLVANPHSALECGPAPVTGREMADRLGRVLTPAWQRAAAAVGAD